MSSNNKFTKLALSLLGNKVVIAGPEEIVVCRYNSRTGDFEPEQENGRKKGEYPRRAILVVCRELYFELNHSFPITSAGDLKKAVELQAPGLSPREFSRFCYFYHVRESESRVNLWFFNPEVEEIIDRLMPLAIIPETTLLGLDVSREQGSIKYARRWGSHVLCFRKPGGDLVSRLEPAESKKEDAISRFRTLAGYEAVDAGETFFGCYPPEPDSETGYFSRLAKRVLLLPFKWWPRFLLREGLRISGITRSFIYFQVAVLVLFFLLPWVFSLINTHSVHQELTGKNREITGKVEQYLEIKEDLDRKELLYKRLKGILEGYTPRAIILGELGKLLKAPEDSLSSMRLRDNYIELRGLTDSSTNLLNRLNAGKGFKEVRLASPVVKDPRSGRERFVIEVILSQKVSP